MFPLSLKFFAGILGWKQPKSSAELSLKNKGNSMQGCGSGSHMQGEGEESWHALLYILGDDFSCEILL